MINLHIIGVQKAGTTALASFLQQHPSVYVVDGKEAHIFDHPNYEKQADKKAFANRKYQHLLSHYTKQKIVCDATPITIFREDFLRACHQYNPEAKFILILRDPTERAISHYHMSREKGAEKRCMLIAFLSEGRRLSKVKQQTSLPFDSPMRQHSYLARGLYRRQLQSLYSIVPQEQVLVLEHKQLKNQHGKTMQEIFGFLGIEQINIEPKVVFSTNKKHKHWSDFIAKLYARLYFLIHR